MPRPGAKQAAHTTATAGRRVLVTAVTVPQPTRNTPAAASTRGVRTKNSAPSIRGSARAPVSAAIPASAAHRPVADIAAATRAGNAAAAIAASNASGMTAGSTYCARLDAESVKRSTMAVAARAANAMAAASGPPARHARASGIAATARTTAQGPSAHGSTVT